MTGGRNTLRDRLARLAQSDEIEADGERVIANGSGTEAVLEAIITVVDETMLAATLTVTAPDAVVVLEVGGRRLRRVISADPSIGPGELAGRSLDVDDRDMQDELAAMMHRFAEKSGRARVTVREDPGPSGSGGLSARRLTDNWLEGSTDELGEDPGPGVAPPDRFFALCGQKLEACLVLPEGGYEEPRILGSPELHDGLQDFAEEVWPSQFGLPNRTEKPSLTLWFPSADMNGSCRGLAAWPGTAGTPAFAVLAFPAQAAATVATAFRHIVDS